MHGERNGLCINAEIAAGADPVAALFRSLGDPTRLEITRSLALGKRREKDFTTKLGLAESTVSEHLNCLLLCGLVKRHVKWGGKVLYEMPKGRQPPMDHGIDDLLMAAGHLLHKAGYEVV